MVFALGGTDAICGDPGTDEDDEELFLYTFEECRRWSEVVPVFGVRGGVTVVAGIEANVCEGRRDTCLTVGASNSGDGSRSC